MLDKFLRYIAYEKRYSPHTLTSYQNDLTQFKNHLATTYQLEELQLADYTAIRSWIIHLSENKINPSSINRKIATLKSFYKFLLRTEVIAKNPTLRVKPLKTAQHTPTFVTEPLIHQLLDQVTFSDDFEGIRDQLILELLYGTGIRLNELIQLKESDFDLFQQCITVTGKGNKQRIIPVHASLVELLKNYQCKKNIHFSDNLNPVLVVTNEGKQTYPMLIYRIVRKYLGLITLDEKRSPHVLRHTFATHLLNKGADINAIKELLGHASLASTQVYTHNSLDRLKEIFNQSHPKA